MKIFYGHALFSCRNIEKLIKSGHEVIAVAHSRTSRADADDNEVFTG